MAHNIMRVDSMNNRYVTETMIDLNLDLNEEIDFDFFDNAETPSEELLTNKLDAVDNSLSRPCSPQNFEDDNESFEDDDDVQINPHLLEHDLSLKEDVAGGTIETSLSGSIDQPLSKGIENEENIGDFDENKSNKTEHTNAGRQNKVEIDNVLSQVSVKQESLEQSFLPSDQAFSEESSCNKPNDSQETDKVFKSHNDVHLESKMPEEKENESSRKSCVSQASEKSSKNQEEDLISLNQEDEASTKSSENPNDHASSKSSKSLKSGGSGSGYNSDEGCPFEDSDTDELLLGVHTLTIIPRENEDTISQRTIVSQEKDISNEPHMIHTSSCEKAAMTARSSSGYSSASCKAHGCIVSRGNVSKVDSRQPSQMKRNTPDMDEFIKSFRKVQPNTPVSFTSSEKYSTSKKRKRRNMSFSNQELQRIERENAILLNKIVLQQRARPSVVHNYERRVTSNAINRARQLKKIESDNEILLRKIQDVKRKSSLSAQSSRCISQASTSQS